MLFNSHEFIFIFLPLALCGFYALHAFGFKTAAWVYLTLASFYFYANWNHMYCLLMLASICVNILTVSRIRQALDRQKPYKIYLYFSVIFNVGLIVYFKYRGLLAGMISGSFGLNWAPIEVFIPLGISFYTFQELAFVLDSKNPETRKIDLRQYPLLVTFFVHLIAGPIILHSQFFHQLRNYNWREKFFDKIGVGLALFIIGLFKKVVLADTIGPIAREMFDGLTPLTFFSAWEGSLAYTYQLYFDFSGYSDMAIGLGAMFGFVIPQNFNSPYKAASIQDFWRRWHMTLSHFLKTYLYIPLGGNRGSKLKTMRNIMLTMVIGGLWHGANWTFLIWGVFHGTLLLLHSLFRQAFLRLGRPPAASYLRLRTSQTLTFFCVVVGWVIFRSHSIDRAGKILNHMSQTKTLGEPNMYYWLIIAIFFAIAAFCPNSHEIVANISKFKLPLANDNRPIHWKPNFIYGLIFAIIATICILRISIRSEFLYFQF